VKTLAGWRFTEISTDQTQRIPREEEFPKRYHTDSEVLVREFIQNAMDARVGRGLRVRISFGEISRPVRWLEGLYDHIEACLRERHARSLLAPGCHLNLLPGRRWKYLVLEDFDTTGLTGETRGRDGAPPEESDFYDLIFWEGGTRKAGRKRGRWGVGKRIYYKCSQIRTFFALTKRCDDNRCLLIGKCVLAPHTLNGKRFDCDGFFREDSESPEIEDPETIRAFSADFGLERNEPGLSIVIPVLEEEITPDAIKAAVISHYFYPIARGELSVQINTPEGSTDINSGTLIELADRLDWGDTWWKNREREDVKKLLQFVYESIKAAPIDLSACPASSEELASTLQRIGVDEIRKRYLAGETLAFRFPIEIKRREGRSIPSFFVVYLKRDESLKNADEYFIRSDILVPGAAGSLKGRQVRMMLVADDEGIAQFLGDAESPFHDEWNERTLGLREKYENPKAILGSVKKTPSLLVDALEGLSQEERSLELFRDYFSLPEETESRGQVIPSRPRIDEKEIKQRRKIPLLELQQDEDGFRLYLTPEGKERLPLTVRIRLAYATLRGDPMRHYRQTDFDVRTLPIQSRGCSIHCPEPNLIELEIVDQDFSFGVSGFDRNRELEVRLEVLGYGK